MSSFFVELWESIFTPGPTPTILKATNASFAALQFVLFLLLLATYSIHCIILSVLCAGLWWSINWFATELYAAQAREREEQARLKEKELEREQKNQPSDGDDDASETEVETAAPVKKSPAVAPAAAAAAADPEPIPAPAASPATGLEPIDPHGEVKHRPGPGTQSSVSTEDEWEKVSENEKDKASESEKDK